MRRSKMFTKEISEITMSLDALRDFSEYVEPLVLEKIEKQFQSEFKAMKSVGIAFEILNKLPHDASDEEINNAKQEIKKYFLEEIEINKEEEGWGISTTGKDSDIITNAMTNMKMLDKQLILMYKSILVNLISTVECYLGNVLKRYFLEYKGEIIGKLIESKDKVYTINELEMFESIESAKEYIIDKKIENLIRGSFEDWYKFLKEKMSLSMGYMNNDYDTMVEIFQRRNIFMHNDGIINRIYISNTEPQVRYDGKIGESIRLTKEYLENAINILEKNFVLIAFELWKKREKDDKSRGAFFAQLSVKYMMQERWTLLESATIFIVSDSAVADSVKKMSKINLWLAQKKLGKMNVDEVRKEDFSALTVDYQICKHALLEEYLDAVKLIDKALDTEQITVKTLYEWPVLEELRMDKSFKDLLARKTITEPDVSQLIYPRLDEIDEDK